jgi:hypothetical protein
MKRNRIGFLALIALAATTGFFTVCKASGAGGGSLSTVYDHVIEVGHGELRDLQPYEKKLLEFPQTGITEFRLEGDVIALSNGAKILGVAIGKIETANYTLEVYKTDWNESTQGKPAWPEDDEPPPEAIYDYTAHSNSWNDLSQFIIDNQGSSNGVANPARIRIINAGELDAAAMTAVNGKVSDAAQYVSLNLGEGNSFAGNEVTSSVMDDIIKDNSYIKGIALPEGVTGFSGYEELVVGPPNYYIYHYAFTNCQYLTSITLPSSVTTIGAHAFENCTGLTGITLPSSVTIIDTYAFANCTSLASVNFPASLAVIYDTAFGGCTALTSIDMSVCIGTVTLYDRVFYGNPFNGQVSGLVSATLGTIDFSYFYGQFPGDDENQDDMKDIYNGPGTYTRDPNGTLWTKQPD